MSATRFARVVETARRYVENADMPDLCEIRRPPTIGELDPETGDRNEVPGELVYGPGIEPYGDGRCKVFTYEAFESTPQSGQHVFTVQRKAVHIPAGALGVRVNDVVEIFQSEMQPELVGRKVRIAGTHVVSRSRDQRLLVDEITA